MKIIIAILVMTTGCSFNFVDHKATHISTASAALATLALDWCGSRGTAMDRRGRLEIGVPTGTILGPTPSPHAMDMWFAASTLAIFGFAQLLPSQYRPYVYTAVVGAEVFTLTASSITGDDIQKGCSL